MTHVGDIKNGSSVCSDEYFRLIKCQPVPRSEYCQHRWTQELVAEQTLYLLWEY